MVENWMEWKRSRGQDRAEESVAYAYSVVHGLCLGVVVLFLDNSAAGMNRFHNFREI
jgi:hypothetical protein